jgi:hypothetical protein
VPTEKQNEAMNLYVALMQEIKIRLHYIDHSINGGLPLYPGPIIHEFGFLQLRFICELIALGCLAAHGDLQGAQAPKLLKEFAADKIVDALDQLHPNFFPRPVTISRVGEGMHADPRIADALTKEQIPILYGRCGNNLHRGNVKKLLSAKTPLQTNFPEIGNWCNKIIALLDNHHIASVDNRFHFFCIMGQHGQPVSVAIAESPPQSPTSESARPAQ